MRQLRRISANQTLGIAPGKFPGSKSSGMKQIEPLISRPGSRFSFRSLRLNRSRNYRLNARLSPGLSPGLSS